MESNKDHMQASSSLKPYTTWAPWDLTTVGALFGCCPSPSDNFRIGNPSGSGSLEGVKHGNLTN